MLLKSSFQQSQRLQSEKTPQSTTFNVSPSLSLPKLGRGFKPGEDIDLDISPQQKVLFDPAKAKALAILKRKGEQLTKTENNFVRAKDKANNPEFKETVQKRLRESLDGSEINDLENIPKRSKSSNTSRSSLGDIDLNSDKIQEMLDKKSRHNNLVQDEEDALMDKYYMKLEKREMMEEQMSSVIEVPTSAVLCHICKYKNIVQSQYCKDEGHVVKSVKALRKFYECSNCKRRTVTLDKMPVKACSNCEHTSWKRVAMGKAKKGPTLDTEVLSLRGNEQAHYSGAAEKAYLHID